MRTKRMGTDAAELKAPPVYQNWKQRNPKVIKEITKFANGGYACHIVSSTQKTELQENLAAIPSTPMDVPNDKQFRCASLWTLWQGNPLYCNAPIPEPEPVEAATHRSLETVKEISVSQYGLSKR